MINNIVIGNKSIISNSYGIVFAGGGGKGAYQAGVIKALDESGLINSIKYASGSSIGAINMCMLSQVNPSYGIKIWDSVKSLEIIDVDEKLIDGKEGFSNREGLINIINKNIDIQRISSSKIEFYATVSEYTSNLSEKGEAKYIKLNGLSNKEIINTLLASSALPYIYEPVKIDGIAYRDGGLTDNLPIKPLYDKGVRYFIIVLLSASAKIDLSKYNAGEFMIIRPSQSLGDLLTGTLNFSRDEIIFREKLGYFDTIRMLKYYKTDIEKSISYEDVIKNSVQDDLKTIKTDIMFDNGRNRFDSKMDKINSIMSKYGIK